MKGGIGQRIAAGAAWMVLFRLSDRALGLISTLILARLLLPDDFGIVAMAMSVLALLEVFTMLGLDVALISKRDVTREHYDTAWTIGIMAAALVALALLGLSIPASYFFSEPRLAPVIAVLAAGAFVQGFENIGVVNFRKELQFDREFRFQLTKRLIAMAVTIPLAFLLRNYWALVAGAVTGRVSWVALSFVAHPYRPRLSLAASRDLFSLSGWLLLIGMLYYFKEQTANLVLGRFSGPRYVGLYTLSYEIASLPTAQLTAPINRAVLPGLAKLASEPSELSQGVLKILALTLMLAVPAGLGLAAVAPLLVPLVLGEKWIDAIPVMQVLAIFSSLAALLSSSYTAFLALQLPRIPAMIDLGYVIMQAVLMILLSGEYGARGAAIAALITVCVAIPINYGFLLQRLELSVIAVLSVVWRPVIAGTTMWLLVSGYVSDAVGDSVADLIQLLAAAVSVGVVSFTVLVFTLWLLAGRPEGAERVILAALAPKLPISIRYAVERVLHRS